MNILAKAAHAVACHRLGFRLFDAWIDDRKGEGQCNDTGPGHLFKQGLGHRQIGFREAIASLAPAALGLELSSGDERCFGRALWLAGFSEPEGLIRREAISLAGEILSAPKNRLALVAVTDALARRKYLTGREIVELIDATDRRGFLV